MKLTYQRIHNIIRDNSDAGVLSIFTQMKMEKDGSPRKVPGKLNHALIKNGRKLTAALKDYDDARLELLTQYCEVDEDGKLKEVEEDGRKQAKFLNDDARKEFVDEHMELLKERVEVPIHLVSFATMDKMDDMGGLEPHLFEGISFMIDGLQEEEPEEEQEAEEAEAKPAKNGKAKTPKAKKKEELVDG